ncbi:MAG: hypothetical protein EBW34_00715, partial [Burkholderiaceae bacterium]|nr:hypothetical protein [Burkholderiaceae bacterium]
GKDVKGESELQKALRLSNLKEQSTVTYQVDNLTVDEFRQLTKDFPIEGTLKTDIDFQELGLTPDSIFKKFPDLNPWTIMDRQMVDLYSSDIYAIKVLQNRKLTKNFEEQMVGDIIQDTLKANKGKEVDLDAITSQAEIQADLYFDNLAKNNAQNEVLMFIDNPAIKNQLDFNARVVGRFIRATNDYARRMVRYISQHPDKVAYRGGMYVHASNGTGLVYEDQDGNTYSSIKDVPPGVSVSVKYPLPYGDKLPNWVKTALQPYTDPRGGGVKFNPKQMEFMVADPSISWFGTATISEIIDNGFSVGPWKMYGEDVALSLRETLGDDVYESSILYGGYPTEGKNFAEKVKNTMVPGYLQSLIDSGKLPYPIRQAFSLIGLEKSERFTDEVYAQWRKGFADWIANGRIGEPPSMKDAAKAAGNMAFIRSVVQFNAPISATFDPVTRAATAYYADLVEMAGGDYDVAQKVMIDEWGLDSLALVGSNQKNVAGVAATLNDIKALRNNTKLLEELGNTNTKYAGMLSSGYGDIAGTGSGPNDYSTEVASIYKRMKYSKRGNACPPAGRSRPASAQAPGLPNGTVAAIETISNNVDWRTYAYSTGNTKWEEIAFWVGKARNFKNEYDRPNNSDERKLMLKQQFSQFHYNFLQTASDEFDAFATRWLNNMPELDNEFVVTK